MSTPDFFPLREEPPVDNPAGHSTLSPCSHDK
jgi:hypothetical protein